MSSRQSRDTRSTESAEEAMLGRTVFTVDAEAYAELIARLDAPPNPNLRLRRALETSAPWEQ